MKLPRRYINDLFDVLSLAENEFQDSWLETTINTYFIKHLFHLVLKHYSTIVDIL